jgi:hypothetical protein
MRCNGFHEVIERLEKEIAHGHIGGFCTGTGADAAVYRYTSETPTHAEEIDRQRHMLLHVIVKIEACLSGVRVKKTNPDHLETETSISPKIAAGGHTSERETTEGFVIGSATYITVSLLLSGARAVPKRVGCETNTGSSSPPPSIHSIRGPIQGRESFAPDNGGVDRSALVAAVCAQTSR